MFGNFECGVKFLGHVSFIRDSGKNIFVRGRFEISGNRSEIFERGVKFMGQVSFIGDSGENIFFSVTVLKFLESFGNFRVWRKICGPG